MVDTDILRFLRIMIEKGLKVSIQAILRGEANPPYINKAKIFKTAMYGILLSSVSGGK
jgi:hypothetical protein